MTGLLKISRQALRIAVAVLMMMLFIAGALCGGRRENTVVVWHSLRPVERQVLRAALDEFAKNWPGWEFSELFYEPEAARSNYIISALGGSGPSLFRGANDNIGPMSELGVIMPLEQFYEQATLDSFLTEPLAANTWFHGHLYQIADNIGNHLCLVYNKKLIAEPPQTMSELIEVGKRLTVDRDGDGKPDQYALVWNYIEPFFAVPFIGGYGGWIIDDSLRPTLNTEALVNAAQLIYDLANVHKIIPLECDYEVANALFKDGLAAMIINGPWSWGTYIDNGLDIGLARIPLIEETELWPSPAVQPMGYSVNSNLKGEKLAVTLALLRRLTTREMQLRYTRISGALPSRIDAFESPEVQDNPLVRASLDQLLVGRVTPPVTELRWIWDAMRPGYQAVFRGRETPRQAAANMQKLAEKLIRENRE